MAKQKLVLFSLSLILLAGLVLRPRDCFSRTQVETAQDFCAKRYSDQTELACCNGLATRLHFLEDPAAQTQFPRAYVSCCAQGGIKPDATGPITQEELQTCTCQQNPLLLNCTCVGVEQVKEIDTCHSTKTLVTRTVDNTPAYAPPVIDTASSKVTLTFGNTPFTLPLCACPNPQDLPPLTDPTAGCQSMMRSIMNFRCLYKEQVDYLLGVAPPEANLTIEKKGEAYEIKATVPQKKCDELSGAETPTAEMATSMASRTDSEPAPADVPPSNDSPIACAITRPACPCEGPPSTTTQTTPPKALTPPKPRVAMCQWGDTEAVYLDTGETLFVECPPLARSAFTKPEALALFNKFSDYRNNPKPEKLTALRTAISDHVANDNSSPDQRVYNAFVVDPTTASADLPAVPQAVDVQASFVNKDLFIQPDDGTLVIRNAESPIAKLLTMPAAKGNPSGTAALGIPPDSGPTIVSRSELFKDTATTVTTPASILVIGVDGAFTKGGGCSLSRR